MRLLLFPSTTTTTKTTTTTTQMQTQLQMTTMIRSAMGPKSHCFGPAPASASALAPAQPLISRLKQVGRTRTRTKLLACLAIAACLAAVLLTAHAYPSGAPEQACKDMRPGHGAEPTAGAAPFELQQDKLQAEAGDQIKVTLSSPDKTTFKGLLVQALDEKGEPVGKFLAGKGLKLLDSCSAVTHADREAKKTATLVWEAPTEMKIKKPVAFRATVVHKFEQFYMNIKSTLAS